MNPRMPNASINISKQKARRTPDPSNRTLYLPSSSQPKAGIILYLPELLNHHLERTLRPASSVTTNSCSVKNHSNSPARFTRPTQCNTGTAGSSRTALCPGCRNSSSTYAAAMSARTVAMPGYSRMRSAFTSDPVVSWLTVAAVAMADATSSSGAMWNVLPRWAKSGRTPRRSEKWRKLRTRASSVSVSLSAGTSSTVVVVAFVGRCAVTCRPALRAAPARYRSATHLDET